MAVVVSAESLINFRILSHRLYESFRKAVRANYADTLYHANIHFLSNGKVLLVFFSSEGRKKLSYWKIIRESSQS
jgi:hypothetical protein